jgi:N-formylglutamate amidohydrolase
MTDTFTFTDGRLPLLISVPHDGREIPDGIAQRMTAAGRAIPDTDWHVARLYDFAPQIGAATIVAKMSRYVVDLNRAATDESLYPGQLATGLCPEETFAGDAIYQHGAVDDHEKSERVKLYWRPYHDAIQSTLNRMRAEHGFALLWDAHSIPSLVPRLFEGELPELNVGTNGGASCHPELEAAVAGVAKASGSSAVVNGRFKGGYITRHYGNPKMNVSAIQLEIAQRAYMDEATTAYDASRADGLRATLQAMLAAYLDKAES